jgi:3-mercaptopyruvate sulfurtransferase SseA
MSNVSEGRGVTPLVTADWLAQRTGTADLLVLDIRSAVDGGGRAAFEEAHIPGAIHTDYAKDGWRAVKGMATGLLPDAIGLKALFARFGLGPADRVIIVSAGTTAGDFCAAARVYWTLKIAGHTAMSILDGGMLGWRADRLPGAVHLDNVLAFDSAAKRLKAPAELQALLANVGGKPVVSYCNTGHQAAITWFALSEILRRPATLYDGSMSEWTEDPARPVATGPE